MTPAEMDAASAIELSVVLACDGSLDRIVDRIVALADASVGVRTEVLVAHSDRENVHLPDDLPLPTRRVTVASALVPLLWGRGIAAARGRVVALTTTQFRVTQPWTRELLAAFDAPDVWGVGGRIALAPGASRLTRAVFLIRYSEHMDARVAPRDIAGDNAAYLRDAVMATYPSVNEGFWEVDAHRLMRSRGGRIRRVPEAVAQFDPSVTVQGMLENRFVHGRHFGAYRVASLRWPRWRAVAVTPLVPAVLLLRVFGRVRRAGQPMMPALTVLPLMVALLVSWAAGEARGAVGAAAVRA